VQNLYKTRFQAPAANSADANQELVCTICLLEYAQDDEIIQLPCDERHFFHSGCITEWLNKNNNCPLCKAPITSEALQEQQRRLQER
jgi:E3 ubiquitin-protein ligase DOA10